MAFAGIHVEFGYGGSTIKPQLQVKSDFGILSKPTATENLAAPGTTTAFAPEIDGNGGQPIVNIIAAADSWASIAAAPNASNNPKVFLQAGIPTQRYCNPGDKVAYVAA